MEGSLQRLSEADSYATCMEVGRAPDRQSSRLWLRPLQTFPVQLNPSVCLSSPGMRCKRDNVSVRLAHVLSIVVSRWEGRWRGKQ